MHTLQIHNSLGEVTLSTIFHVCPNQECRRFTLFANLRHSSTLAGGTLRLGTLIETWRLIPSSKAKSFPDYIPEAIRQDYKEACLIQDLSPKASATLSRRCLQGILRNFWQVKPGRLVDEIDRIKDKVDPITWDAIDAVRQIGNIGAHMEKDIDVIVDVDPGEAELLIQLIETLLREWYIARHEREARMRNLVATAAAKNQKPETGS